MQKVNRIEVKNLILIFITVLLIPSVFSEDIEPFTGVPGAILVYSMPGYLDAYVNETTTFLVKVSNSGNITLNNIFIEISGIPSQAFSINPSLINRLDLEQSLYFSVSINTQDLSIQPYTLEINLKSDETSGVASLVLNVKELPRDVEDVIKKQKQFEGLKPTLASIAYLFAGVIVASIVVIIIMLVLFKAKRCPLCGGKVEKEFEGTNYVTYKCNRCRYYKLRIKKTT
jgi:hypothetical protein